MHKTKKSWRYVAGIMGATLTRECMATHSYKGQKGKNGQVKPRLDSVYTRSLIGKCITCKQKMEKNVCNILKVLIELVMTTQA